MAQRRSSTQREDQVKGWADIARFLELPASTAQRWAREGMPVKREGRFVVASRQELADWIGSSRSGESTVLANDNDLAAELRRSVKALKRKRAA